MDENCQNCARLKTKCKAELRFKRLVLLHTDVLTIKGNNRLDSKKTFLGKYETCVAALRNTEGGCIIIHIQGQEAWDRYLEDFDQCFGKCIEDQIEGGQLFTNTCKRYWISELENFNEFTDCILIEVLKTEGVVTVDFNTKLRSDFENRKPSCINVISLLNLQSESSSPKPIIENFTLNEGFIVPIEESRHVELKSITQSENNAIKSNLEAFIRYIWTTLKLKENISSLSKVREGGSFIVGLAQVPVRAPCTYRTKQTTVEGFELAVDEKLFLDALTRKFSTDLCVLSGDTFEDFDEHHVDIKLHQVHRTTVKYILEVALGHVSGVVFYDKQGPRTYLWDNDFTKRMEREEWLRRLRTIRIPRNVAD